MTDRITPERAAELLALRWYRAPPWEIDPNVKGRVNGPDGRSVGAAHRSGRFAHDDPIQAANARLIAAAPDLLALARQQAAEIERLRNAIAGATITMSHTLSDLGLQDCSLDEVLNDLNTALRARAALDGTPLSTPRLSPS